MVVWYDDLFVGGADSRIIAKIIAMLSAGIHKHHGRSWHIEHDPKQILLITALARPTKEPCQVRGGGGGRGRAKPSK